MDNTKFHIFLIKLGSSITLLINVFIYTVLLVVYLVTDAERCMSRNITDWTGTFKSCYRCRALHEPKYHRLDRYI